MDNYQQVIMMYTLKFNLITQCLNLQYYLSLSSPM